MNGFVSMAHLAAGSEGAAEALVAAAPVDPLLPLLVVFVLAVFLGFEVISKVPQQLHTPLMSGSNAISGITIVGALVCAGGAGIGASTVLGFLAVVLAMVNVVGGFAVTDRMLKMFRSR